MRAHRERRGWGPRLGLAIVLAAVVSCGGDDEENRFKVLTLNMYIGFGQDVLNGDLSDPDELAAAVQRALTVFRLTNSEGRIDGMGRLIAEEQPVVVGLQEVMAIHLTRGTPDPGDDAPFVDFLADLLDAVEDAGGPRYQSFQHVNNELEGSFDLLGREEAFRFREADVVLVHPDADAQAVGAGLRYSALLPVGPVYTPGGIVQRVFVRGAQHVQVTHRGHVFEVFNTHLEVNGENNVGTPFQQAQARELVQYIAASTASRPTSNIVLTGDMNGTPTSVTYTVLRNASLRDTFGEIGLGEGLTCCQLDSLQNPNSVAFDRIDYVFYKAGTATSLPVLLSSNVVLDERVPRSDGGGQIWPSDHFAVLTEFALP